MLLIKINFVFYILGGYIWVLVWLHPIVQEKFWKDVIFGASAACNEAIQKYGADKVTNGTIGAIMDDEGKLICIPTVEKVLRSLPLQSNLLLMLLSLVFLHILKL